MRKQLFLTLALGLSVGLAAYGVSPSQYQAGQAQDERAAMSGPRPLPVPGSAVAPGAPGAPGAPQFMMAPQAATTPQDYDAVAVPDWAKGWKHYHWSEALALWQGKKALFCDARSKPEYDQSHIPGAIPLPLAEFDKYYALYKNKIKHAKYIVTYCHGANCQLSNKVAQKLVEEKKFKNVGSFFGGWPEWQQHNMPVESGGTPKPR